MADYLINVQVNTKYHIITRVLKLKHSSTADRYKNTWTNRFTDCSGVD